MRYIGTSVKQKLDKFDEALEIFDKALEIVPEHVYVLLHKGLLLLKLERYNEALSCYDKVIQNSTKQCRSTV